MTDETKRRIRAALASALGNAEDNAARARRAFRGLDVAAMAKQYGESGSTCEEVLAQYETEESNARRALGEFDRETA